MNCWSYKEKTSKKKKINKCEYIKMSVNRRNIKNFKSQVIKENY